MENWQREREADIWAGWLLQTTCEDCTSYLHFRALSAAGSTRNGRGPVLNSSAPGRQTAGVQEAGTLLACSPLQSDVSHCSRCLQRRGPYTGRWREAAASQSWLTNTNNRNVTVINPLDSNWLRLCSVQISPHISTKGDCVFTTGCKLFSPVPVVFLLCSCRYGDRR